MLHTVLHTAADTAPDNLAVVDGPRRLTYAQLEASANRTAHQLTELGVLPGERVGLYLEKSAESLACVYGVLKIGAVYVPMAAEAPASRLADIVRDAGIRVLLTGVERAPRWSGLLGPDSPVEYLVCVNGPADEARARYAGGSTRATVLGTAELGRQPDTRPDVASRPDDLAYVLYTSGSTGVPKGVMLSHRNALAFVDWAVGAFSLTSRDRLSNHAPLNFDLSVFDIFAAARVAAAVVLVPREATVFPAELAALVRETGITVWYSVPSAVARLAARSGLGPGSLARVRLVLFAGEPFPVDQLRNAMDWFPDAEFHNLFGPTETNVCTAYRVPRPLPESVASLPIGTPIDGVEVLCRTDDGRVAGAGERGELWVSGPTVMRGYLGDPQSTARVLRAPDDSRPQTVGYRTGDMVVRDDEGVWHFLGRRDSQIKSRGYRIELGEIEVALNAHPAVEECAVVPVPDAEFGNRIAAYVVVSEQLTGSALTGYARRALPGYMVPWSFEMVGELPRTATGKIDYQELRKLSERTDRARRH
jgi:amino acid adenylation domain-containing protein